MIYKSGQILEDLSFNFNNIEYCIDKTWAQSLYDEIIYRIKPNSYVLFSDFFEEDT